MLYIFLSSSLPLKLRLKIPLKLVNRSNSSIEFSLTKTVDPTVNQLLESFCSTGLKKFLINSAFLLKYFVLKVLFNDVLCTCTLSTLEKSTLTCTLSTFLAEYLYLKYF